MYPSCNDLFNDLFDLLDDVRVENAFPFYFTLDFDDSQYVKSLIKSELAYNSFINDNDKSYNVTFALAGVDKDNIKIEKTSDEITLTVKALDDKELEKKKNAYFHHGIKLPCAKDIESHIVVPKEYDADKLEASYENGLLTLKMPLKDEAKPIEVKIK